MQLHAGTSGYAFKEWKGVFYPADLKDAGFLGYYATRFPAVEINNTFYRLPRENVIQDWASQVPDGTCSAHAADHVHGPNCGHEAVPHGDHVDYLVDGHLHHPHNGHCDNHGPVAVG